MAVIPNDTEREAAQEAANKPEYSPAAQLRKRMFGHAGFLFGATVLGLMCIMALLAPYVSPHDPYDQVLSRKLIPPVWFDSPKATWDHILGTDQLGRDYLSRLLWGARISLSIGILSTVLLILSGVVIGSVAALPNRGDGWFILPAPSVTLSHAATAGIVTDLESDGRLDMIVLSTGGISVLTGGSAQD